MSDYPKGGDIASTRAWLDKKGFIGIFNNWEADAILGLPEEKIMVKVPGERGEILWGFLNTASQTTGKRMMSSSSDRKVEKAGDRRFNVFSLMTRKRLNTRQTQC